MSENTIVPIPYRFRVKRFLTEQDHGRAIGKARVAHGLDNRLRENARTQRREEFAILSEVAPELAEQRHRFKAKLAEYKEARKSLSGSRKKTRGNDGAAAELKAMAAELKELCRSYGDTMRETAARFDDKALSKSIRDEFKAEFIAKHGKPPATHTMATVNEQVLDEVRRRFGESSPEHRILAVRRARTEADRLAYAETVNAPRGEPLSDEQQETRVGWTTCNLVKTHVRKAESSTGKRRSKIDGWWEGFPAPKPMERVRLNVEFSDGTTTADLYSDGKFLRLGLPRVQPKWIERIDPTLPKCRQRVRDGEEREVSLDDAWSKKSDTVLVSARVNVGTASAPLWIGCEIFQHRRIPEGTVKQAWLREERIGTQWEWYLTVLVETEHKIIPAVTNHVVAINLGWRSKPGKDTDKRQRGEHRNPIRVAYAVGTDGVTEEVLLTGKITERHTYGDRLLGFADDHFNAARKVLCEARKAGQLSEAMMLVTENAWSWRAHKKLFFAARDLAQELAFDPTPHWHAWKTERLGAKLDLFDSFDVVSGWASTRGLQSQETLALYLDLWQRKNLHLTTTARRMERRLARRKEDFIRNVLGGWLRVYSVLVFDNTNYSEVKRSPVAEQDERTEQEVSAATNMHRASPAKFREIAEQVDRGSGRVLRLEKDDTKTGFVAPRIVATHHGCGGRLVGSKMAALMMRCEKCGCDVDQDENRCRNMLDTYREQFGGDENAGTARKVKGAERTGKSDDGSERHEAAE